MVYRSIRGTDTAGGKKTDVVNISVYIYFFFSSVSRDSTGFTSLFTLSSPPRFTDLELLAVNIGCAAFVTRGARGAHVGAPLCSVTLGERAASSCPEGGRSPGAARRLAPWDPGGAPTRRRLRLAPGAARRRSGRRQVGGRGVRDGWRPRIAGRRAPRWTVKLPDKSAVAANGTKGGICLLLPRGPFRTKFAHRPRSGDRISPSPPCAGYPVAPHTFDYSAPPSSSALPSRGQFIWAAKDTHSSLAPRLLRTRL